jgi:hypothetical protein
MSWRGNRAGLLFLSFYRENEFISSFELAPGYVVAGSGLYQDVPEVEIERLMRELGLHW